LARQEAKLEINQFTGGLNTDSTELTTPENVSTDEDNFNLLKEGTRRRRLGFDLEDASFTTLTSDGPTMFVGNHRWENVAKITGLNFEVIQTGSILRFYTASISPLADGVKAFTVDLDNFKAPLASRTDLTGVSIASGKGVLFVTGENITPFYITYNAITDAITTTAVNLKVRDLQQLDTTDPEIVTGTLSANRRYDLLNQGWYKTNVIIGSSTKIVKITTSSSNPNTSIPGYEGAILDGYIETFNENPPKTKPWWVGKGTITADIHINVPGIFNDIRETREVEAFSKDAFDLFFGGNTVAPLGHYVVDPFYKDRESISGVNGIDAEVESRRPSAVAFYGGRAFYGLSNTLYFSQVILDDLTAAERCYQDADPTAEDSIGLIASDGGVITIPDMGDIIRLFVVEGALLIFADNGIWSLYSPQGRGFSATDFTVDFVTNLAATGYHSIVDVEGYPVYWGEKGIYAVQTVPERIAYQVQDLTDRKIKNYYEDITPLAKKYAKGAYDLVNRRIIWLWKTGADDTDDRFLFNRVLNYSMMFDAFFPYSVAIHEDGGGSDKDRGICGIVNASAVGTGSIDEQVVANGVSDDNFDDIEFYYPLDNDNQYVDLGPNGLAAATPNGAGAIVSVPNFPLNFGYDSGGTADKLDLPDFAVPDRGTGDWTFEFWFQSAAYNVGPDRTLFYARDDGQTGPGNSFLSVRTFPTGIWVTLGAEDGTGVGTGAGGQGATTLVNGDAYFISVTRNGNSIYVHLNGTLELTFSVTGLVFNFTDMHLTTPGLLNAAEFSPNGIGLAGQDAFYGEARWTNVARYTSSNYSTPVSGLLGAAGGDVESAADGLVVVTRSFVTESSIAVKYMVLQNSTSTAQPAELAFGDFTDDAFEDWGSSTFGDDYTSYIETFYHLTDDAMLYMQAPWIYTYIKRTSTTFPDAEGNGAIASGDVGGAWTGV
jgi:hypothetical protein